jgi:hypothetical protein
MSCLPFTCSPFTCLNKCAVCNKSHNKKEIKIASKKDNTVNINSFTNVTFPIFELLFNNIKQEVYRLLNEENNVSKLDRVIISYKFNNVKDMYNEVVSYLYFELRNISDCNIYCFKNAESINTELMFRFNIVKEQLINFNIYLQSVYKI